MIFVPALYVQRGAMRLQVERVDRAGPGAEVVDAVQHERRRLDRRAGRVAPAHLAVVPVEHVDVAVHRVDDHVLAVHRGRGGHDPAEVAAPGALAVAHRVGADARVVVGDEGDVGVDHGRELHQPADGRAPDDPERRPHADLVMRLRPARVGAVERPLQLRLVDAHADLGPVAELQALLVAVVAALGDLDLQARMARDPDLGDARAVGAAGEAADLDAGLGHRLARVAVEDDHVHLRALRRWRRAAASASRERHAWSSAPPACPRNNRRRAARARTKRRAGAPAPG